MSSSAQNLTLEPNFTIDPNIPQSTQASVAQINDATKAQVALINATTTGGRPRRRRRYGSKKGGDPNTIVVNPLPLGMDTANSQANNVAAAKLFANAVTASTYDNAVTPAKVGGGNRRRLSKKRTQKRRRTKRRSTKYRKMMKGKKSRRTRRR